MSQSQLLDLLDRAAAQIDGGSRSFPTTDDARFALRHAYAAPNKHYQMLFFHKATVLRSQANTPSSNCSSNCSAGWLLPDDLPGCNPVFVAHSILSAIWLLRETLPNDALPNTHWELLAQAAHQLTQDTEDEIPPSAQRPRNSTPPSSKRPAPTDDPDDPDNPPTPKRARVEPGSDDQGVQEDSDASSPISTREPEPTPPIEEPTLITTVTNNNRRAELARKKKQKAQALKKRQSLGLEEPCEDAPRSEHAAYASILPKDEPVISWIFRQPIDASDLYKTANSPYATATNMLEKALALGNQSARCHAASFLHIWRRRGTPFPIHSAPSSSLSATIISSGLVRRALPWMHDDSMSQPSAISDAFRHAWDTVNHYEGQMAAIHIQYRWAMAFLGRTYADKIALLKQEDEAAGRGQSRSRNGKGKLRTEAMTALLPLVCDKITGKDKENFKRRLQRATRWYEAANRLGWGSLCLMPHDLIANTWVEQTLRVGEWRVWLELVEKVNHDAYTASKALESWLGSECIAGGSINGKEALRIEAIYEVEEIQDSEDDEGLSPTQSQASVSSAEPVRPLRQLTLPELFKPQDSSR